VSHERLAIVAFLDLPLSSSALPVFAAFPNSRGARFARKYGDRYLRHDGPEHVLAVAPTRSGKGVGRVLPTLLTWPGSAVIHDIKGENCGIMAQTPPWPQKAGWRAPAVHGASHAELRGTALCYWCP